MGLIRWSLAISTIGVVNPRSKKQRVARAQLSELRAQTALIRDEADQAERDRAVTAHRVQRASVSDDIARATVQRQQDVTALWRMYQAGALTTEQYTTTYEQLTSLPPQSGG